MGAGPFERISARPVKPTKKLDRDYSGQYDFLLDGNIRIEVKASRAVDFESDEPLYVKALAAGSKRPFDMNFQQIKPGCCDVFVWVGVWRDVIRYWVLSSKRWNRTNTIPLVSTVEMLAKASFT